ncbi:MAG: hypothetical protein GX591_03315 [Planctomycetes bacterium]|nr:hypothetical protein [Planctomycetota bacterium]
MDKQNLLNRLAAALGQAPADQGAGDAPAEGSGDEGGAEPQRIGTMMPSMARPQAGDEDLAKALADVVAVAERAGRMLEAQAKRQQTAGDAVAELGAAVRRLADQSAARTEALASLQAALDDLHATLARQMRAHAEALADIQTRVHGSLDRLRRWAVLTAVLAGAAFGAALLVLVL